MTRSSRDLSRVDPAHPGNPSSTGVSAYNPSLDLQSLAHRLLDKGQKAVIAVAPAHEENSDRREFSSREAPPRNWDRGREEGERRASDGDGQEGVGDGKEKGAGAEWLAAKDFAAWLVEELGGPQG